MTQKGAQATPMRKFTRTKRPVPAASATKPDVTVHPSPGSAAFVFTRINSKRFRVIGYETIHDLTLTEVANVTTLKVHKTKTSLEL
jgi:hypothetical protein